MEITINFLSDNDSDEEAKCIQIEEDGSPFQVVDTCTITIEGGGVRTETKGKKKNTPRQIIWKKNNLIIPESQKEFKGCTEIPTEVKNLQTPYSFFTKFFQSSLFDYITEQSIQYSAEKDPANIVEVTSDSIQKYIGIFLTMSHIGMPNIRDYWSNQYGNKMIMDTMTGKVIKKSLFFHFY